MQSGAARQFDIDALREPFARIGFVRAGLAHERLVAEAFVGPAELCTIALEECDRRGAGSVGPARRPVLAGVRASTRSSFRGRAGLPTGSPTGV